jgi:asparagine synthase (glutamine-hydrolysing)
MCGIVGVVDRQGAASEAVVRQMASAIVHRGPDDEGYFTDGPVALGFRRLSIIDLRDGHQPMRSDCGRFTIVFNGEIYNHLDLREKLEKDHAVRFRTRSDTEVLLCALRHWGEAALERLNGMYAFALWDGLERSLVLARDRMGKKPLFYARTAGGFRFASEVKALLRHPEIKGDVDRSRIASFLAYRYVPGEETLFRDVHCLPPASSLRVSGDAEPGTPRQYWDLWSTRPDPALADVPAAEAQLDALLTDSVRRRMVADVPVGAFLSGGLDSSVVVSLMAENHPEPVKTFSVGFDTGFSELTYAREVSSLLRTDHHEVLVDANELMRHVPAVLAARETPITEASDIPIYLLSRLARTKVTVVLSGEGADEVFAGYPKYAFERAWAAAGRLVPRSTLRAAARLLPFGLRRLQLALETVAEPDRLDRHAAWFGGFGPREREALLLPDLSGTAGAHAAVASWLEGRHTTTLVEEAQRLDARFWLPANLLLRGDRMTMAHSLELRCPFLDYRLVELGSRLPMDLKVRGRSGKWLLKRIARRRLPAAIVERRKWGFKVPLDEWFRGPLAPLLRDVLHSPQALGRGYFRDDEVRRLVDTHVSGRRNYEKQLWILLLLELWHRMFVDGGLSRNDRLT